MPEVKINEEKCSNCNTCIEICPVEVFLFFLNAHGVAKLYEYIGFRVCFAQCSG